jgi:DNA-binding GntR family transcriptional regulator
MLAAVSAAAPTPPPARPVRRLRPSTLPDEILRELRSQLIRGELQPGDRIRADLVAEELGVSVIPVREALRVLLAESRVELEPHRGYRVTVLSPAQIGEIFLIARLLEDEALRRGVPAMDAAADARMMALLADLEAVPSVLHATDETLWPLISVHQDFHFVPMESAGLPRLVSELRRLWDHTDHYRSIYLFTDESLYRPQNAEHRAIYEACLARDAEEAVRLNDTHRDHVLQRMGIT